MVQVNSFKQVFRQRCFSLKMILGFFLVAGTFKKWINLKLKH